MGELKGTFGAQFPVMLKNTLAHLGEQEDGGDGHEWAGLQHTSEIKILHFDNSKGSGRNL